MHKVTITQSINSPHCQAQFWQCEQGTLFFMKSAESHLLQFLSDALRSLPPEVKAAVELHVSRQPHMTLGDRRLGLTAQDFEWQALERILVELSSTSAPPQDRAVKDILSDIAAAIPPGDINDPFSAWRYAITSLSRLTGVPEADLRQEVNKLSAPRTGR